MVARGCRGGGWGVAEEGAREAGIGARDAPRPHAPAAPGVELRVLPAVILCLLHEALSSERPLPLGPQRLPPPEEPESARAGNAIRPHCKFNPTTSRGHTVTHTRKHKSARTFLLRPGAPPSPSGLAPVPLLLRPAPESSRAKAGGCRCPPPRLRSPGPSRPEGTRRLPWSGGAPAGL